MEWRTRGVVRALPVVAALLVALPVSTANAQSERACWRAVLADWASSGIERRHPASCYRSALHNLPNDIRTYTTAEDDIRRALLDEIRSLRRTGGDGGRRAGGAGGPSSSAAAEKSNPTRSLQGRRDTSPGISVVTPAAETSPPVRAIVAGGMALMLVLAAAIGKYHVRRRAPHARP